MWVAALMLLQSTTSCVSRKQIRIFQDEDLTEKVPAFFPQERPAYQLVADDIISVRIKMENPEISQGYNLEGANIVNQGTPGANYLNSYTINDSGSIVIPIIGKVKVAGMTVSEAQKAIQEEVDQYLKRATAIVHLVNFKISVLGEVNRPGYYFINHNQITVLEALALAGDMTEFADRGELILVRQKPDGSDAVPINLADLDVLNSNYYFLRPNDVLYVAPAKERSARSNLATVNLFNTLFAGISTTISVILLINR